MVTVQGEPRVTNSSTTYNTNLPKLTIDGKYFSSVASKNTLSFTCTTTSNCGHNDYGCLGEITGEVVSASSGGDEIVFDIWKWGYYNGCDNEQGSQIQVQVSVEGITSSSDWATIGYFQSVEPEISNETLPVLGSDYPYITVMGYGFAVQSDSSGGSETVVKDSESLTYSYENTIIEMYQGGGASTYTTDSGDSTTLPTIKGSIVSSSRSRLVISFSELSPLNQDSIQSGDVALTLQTSYSFSDNIENSTLSAGPTNAFTVKAESPSVDVWESSSCGLDSTSSHLTITGSGFYSADDDVIEVAFDSTIVNASVVNSTYSHITISFSELSAVSSGNLSLTVSVPSSKCWEDSCYGVCLDEFSDSTISQANVTAESCENIFMASSCSFQCNDGYTASDTTMCLRTGSWDTTTAQCNADCDTVTDPTNGALDADCVAPLTSGSTCDITCDSGYSADGTASCTNGVFDSSSCLLNCDSSSFSAPSNGDVGDCLADLNHGEYCTMDCENGYSISANSTCTNGTLSTVTCLADCDISGLVLESDQTEGTCTSNLTSGGTCDVVCTTDNTSPSESITCTDGTLSTVTCMNICLSTSFSAPSNGALGTCDANLNHGDTCTMECDAGYAVNGTSTCSDGVLSSVTCEFDSTYDSACDFSSGFADSTTTWYGCRDVGVDTSNYPYGSCDDSTGYTVRRVY